MIRHVVFVLGLASSVAVMSCGKKKAAEEAQQQITDSINNALAVGYPDGLSIPTFPKTTTAASLALSANNTPDDTSTNGQSLAQKRADAKKILEAGADVDCFANVKKRLALQLLGGENCYQFDQEMIYGYKGGETDGSGRSNVFGTKDGKSSKGTSEVCMVSFAREQMKEIEIFIDQQLDRAQAMACIAKKNNKELPAADNASIDITAEMNAKKPNDVNAPTFSLVKLTKLSDPEGKTVFETKIESTRGSSSEKLTILHRPASASDNSSYNGVISIERSGDATRDQGKAMLVSVEYSRADGRVKASVRRARFATTLTPFFDTTGLVNFAAAGQTDTNSTIEGISLVEFDMNQADSTGTLSYWKNPGGNYDEAARGFVFKVEADTATTVKGCSLSGASLAATGNQHLSIRKALATATLVKPTGWYHPFFHSGAALSGNPNYDFENSSDNSKWKKPDIAGTLSTQFVTNQMGFAVSRQCFKQDSTGAYVLDGNFGTAGYELVQTSDTSKVFNPPDVSAIKGKVLKR